MTEKELAYIVNRDRRIRPYRNWLIGLCLVPLLNFIVMAIDPLVGVIMVCIWFCIVVFFIVIFCVKQNQVKAEIKKELIAEQQAQAAQARQQKQTSPVRQSQQTAPVRQPQQTAPTRQQQSVTERQQAIVDGVERLLENPIVKVATTYAVGKTATEAVKKTGIGSGIVNGSNSKKYKETIINDSITRQLPGGGVRIPVKSKADGNFGITLYLVKMPDGSETLITSVSRVVAKYDPVKRATYTGDGKRIGNGNQLHTLYKKA